MSRCGHAFGPAANDCGKRHQRSAQQPEDRFNENSLPRNVAREHGSSPPGSMFTCAHHRFEAMLFQATPSSLMGISMTAVRDPGFLLTFECRCIMNTAWQKRKATVGAYRTIFAIMMMLSVSAISS